MARKRKGKASKIGPRQAEEGYKEHLVPQEDPEKRAWENVNETAVGKRGEEDRKKGAIKTPPGP